MKEAFLAWLSLVCLAAPTHQPAAARSAVDQWPNSRLEQVVVEFGSSGRGADALRTASRSVLLARLGALQSRSAATSVQYRYLTFALAYFGGDYRRNVRRLIRPVLLWERGAASYQAYEHYGFPGPIGPLDDVPALLGRLYRHNHDPALLRTLFSMGLDGGPSEGLAYERVQLLTRYPYACLKALEHSRGMTAEAVGDFDLASRAEYGRAAAAIKRAARTGDPPLQRFADRFLRQIAVDRQRVKEQNHPHAQRPGA